VMEEGSAWHVQSLDWIEERSGGKGCFESGPRSNFRFCDFRVVAKVCTVESVHGPVHLSIPRYLLNQLLLPSRQNTLLCVTGS